MRIGDGITAPAPTPALATFGRRACALLIDALIVAASTALLLLIVQGEGMELYSMLSGSDGRIGYALRAGAALLIPFVAYEGILLQMRGQTVGKMAVGLRVVGADGERVAAWQAWVRPFVRVLFRWLAIVDYGAALFTRQKTCVHDLAARTRVVRVTLRATAARDDQPLSLSRGAARKQGALWVLWTVGTLGGWIAGVMAAELVGGLRSRSPVLQGVPANAAVGALVGVAQWLVLRRQLPRAWPWVPVTAAAWAVSWWLIDRLESSLDEVRLAVSVGVIWWVDLTAGTALHWVTGWAPDLDSLHRAISYRPFLDGLWMTAPSLVITLSGAVLGAAQLPLLRRSVARAGWWVFANAAAYAAAAWAWMLSVSERRMAAVWLGMAFVVLQWFLLRPRLPRLSLWAPVCALVWPLALARLEDDFAFIILFSTMTALCLEWLLQQPR